jgi:hypothetical protein
VVALDRTQDRTSHCFGSQSLERGRAGATRAVRSAEQERRSARAVRALATAHGGEDGHFIAWGESGAITVAWLLPIDPDPRAAEDDGEALAIGCASLFEQLAERIGVDAVGGP